MNAYELADHLEKYFDAEPYTSEVATMLRQQADRIAELEKKTKPLSDEEIFDLTAWKKTPYELYVEMEKEDMIAFARAIEKRHGIK